MIVSRSHRTKYLLIKFIISIIIIIRIGTVGTQQPIATQFLRFGIITSPPEGVARYCFHPVCLSVCLYVCVSVCPANILVFYFSDIRRDIDLICIHDTYRVVLNSLK